MAEAARVARHEHQRFPFQLAYALRRGLVKSHESGAQGCRVRFRPVFRALQDYIESKKAPGGVNDLGCWGTLAALMGPYSRPLIQCL